VRGPPNRAGLRHTSFQEVFNIGSFDGNATPESPDDESGPGSAGSLKRIYFSIT
jgi:hypothetical protein